MRPYLFTEAIFHSPASAPPFPESSLLSWASHGFFNLILATALGGAYSTPFYKEVIRPAKSKVHRQGQSQNLNPVLSGIIG